MLIDSKENWVAVIKYFRNFPSYSVCTKCMNVCGNQKEIRHSCCSFWWQSQMDWNESINGPNILFFPLLLFIIFVSITIDCFRSNRVRVRINWITLRNNKYETGNENRMFLLHWFSFGSKLFLLFIFISNTVLVLGCRFTVASNLLKDYFWKSKRRLINCVSFFDRFYFVRKWNRPTFFLCYEEYGK